jgi:hypothetical protein
MKRKNFLSFFDTAIIAVLLACAITITFGEIPGAVVGIVTIFTWFLPMPTGVLGLNNISNSSARESYNHAKRMLFKAFRDKFESGAQGDQRCSMFVENLKLSQSEIRLEVQLTVAANIFTFGVTPQQASTGGAGAPFNTENRLQLQDSLCVNEYGIFVGNPASATDTAWQLRTYGNQVDFGAAPANALDSTFYSHGNFLIKANNDVIMPYRGLFNHWYKGETQQTAAVGAASPGDQIRGAQDGMITDEPNIVLIGSKNYQPQIVLPTALAAVTSFERAIVIFRGILAQNSTVVS